MSTTECKDCEKLSSEFLLDSPVRPKLTKAGKVILGITGATFGAMVAIATPFALPAVRRFCLPYVPATDLQVDHVLRALVGRKGTLLDLGSGDGRIVMATARNGFTSAGVELNPWLVWYSRLVAFKTKTPAKFYRNDLWKMKLGAYDNIVIFGVEQMMAELSDKLTVEMGADARVIVCRFPLPNWTPITTVGSGIDAVWVYAKP